MHLAPGPFRRDTDPRRPALSMVALAIVLIWGLAVNGVGAVLPVAAQEDEPPVTSTVVPADALAYAVVPLDQSSSQREQALDLLERAGLGPTVDQLRDEAFGGESDEPVPMELFLGGELAIVVTDTAAEVLINEALISTSDETFENITETGLAVVLTADSPAFIATAIEAAIAQTAEVVGGEVQQTEHEGIDIEYVEVPAGSDETPLATARVDDYVFVAGFPSDLEPLIETSQDTRPSLASLDEFNQVRSVLDEPHLAFGYVNPFPSDELRAAIGALGLPVGYFAGPSAPSGFLIAADDAGFRLETVALGTAGSDRETAFSAEDLLARTPDDALVFIGGGDLAGTGLLGSLGALGLALTGLAPPALEAESLEEQIEAQFMALAENFGVNPRTEIFQHLTGDYGAWLALDAATGAISALFAAEVDEPETVAGALRQITLIVQSGGSGAITVVTRPVGDESRVFTIEIGDPTVSRVEYGVVDDELVVGLGDGIDAIDPGPDQPLTEADRLQTILSALPDPESGMLYVDLAQAIPLMSAATGDAGVESLTNDLGETTRPGAEAAASPVTAADAHPDCANYDTQEDAQAAYDAFAPGSFRLDQDFDGVACEDFFNGATPVVATPLPRATPVAAADDADEMPPAAMVPFSAFGLVAYEEDGNSRTSSLLLVAEAEE